MKIPTLGLRVAAVGLLAGLTGCASSLTPSAQTQARIQERTAAYQSLTPQQQNDILGGAIQRGNTPDMVYMALGKPAKVVTSADGKKAMWVYVEYYSGNAATTTSLNRMGAAHNYATGQTSEMAAPTRYVVARAATEASPGSTTNLTPMQSLDLPDLKSNTVYVFFYLGKVAEIKLDGDSVSDLAQPPPAPSGKKTLAPRSAHNV